MKIAIYPGTFDPITKGHIDIVERASKLFDEIIIGVASSSRKKPMFDIQKRVNWCKESLDNLSNVKVLELNELLVTFAINHKAQFVIRGIRTASDVDYELSLATMNQQLSHQFCETIFLCAQEKYRHISATLVREIIALRGDVSLFVPDCVIKTLWH